MVSQAIAQRNAKNAPRRLLKGVSVLSDLADGGAIYGYPGDYPGKIYFVNNISGDSDFDGLSWETPFAQVSEAITAAEAHRLTFNAYNRYIRNIIYIQGTGTSYEALEALPTCCDIIGIGADPRGDGTGIVVIKGADADACTDDHSYSNYIANIQFAVSGDTGDNAMDTGVFLGSTIENCTFMGSADADTEVCNAAWRASSHFASTTVRNCQFGGTNGVYAFNHGFEQSGGVGNNNLFENNVFFGVVYGVEIAEATNDHGTVWKGNIMSSHIGATEPSTGGFRMGLYSHAVANYCVGVDAIKGAAVSQTIFNFVNAGGTGGWEDALGA